jgi:fatty-acyl-CoA synthase
MATPHELRQAAGTVGLPPLGIHIKILDTAGKSLKPGETGHICVQSPMLFKGYVGGGHKHSFDGFMNSGDVGHLNEQGLLFIDGREDDMIISGGENVFPQEVEELLAKHPGVADVAVIGVADAEFGQRLKAFIVLQRDQVADEELLKNYIKQHLARYKMPREFVFLPELPRNITGKVLKKALAAM